MARATNAAIVSARVERVARAIYRRRLTDMGLYRDAPDAMLRAVNEGWPLCVSEAAAAIEAMELTAEELPIPPLHRAGFR
jgi:Fe2+ transport system protein FeoA